MNQSFGKCIQSWSKSKCTKSSMGELIIGWFRLTLHCTNSWRTYLQFWVHPPQGFVFSQYQRGVSLMLNIWCFCKTFVRPSTRDCQQQPCFLTQIPTRHQIISAGGAFFFHSKRSEKLPSKCGEQVEQQIPKMYVVNCRFLGTQRDKGFSVCQALNV